MAALYGLGQAALAQKNYTQAVERFEQVLAAEEARGMRAAEGGDFTKAAEHFRKGVEMAPDSVSLRYNLARALSLTGDTAGAMAAFEETIRRAPADVDARLAFGELLGRSGRFEDALTQYREVLAVDPKRADARFGYAGALVGLGRTNEAMESLAESARFFPDQPRFAEAQARLRGGRP